MSPYKNNIPNIDKKKLFYRNLFFIHLNYTQFIFIILLPKLYFIYFGQQKISMYEMCRIFQNFENLTN